MGGLIGALQNLAEKSARLTIKDYVGLSNDLFDELFDSDDVNGPKLFPGGNLSTKFAEALNDTSGAALRLLGNELVDICESRTGGLWVVGDVYPFNALIKNGTIKIELQEPALNGVTSGVTLFEEVALGSSGTSGTIPGSNKKYSTDGNDALTTVDLDDTSKGLIVRMAFQVVSDFS
jgi:hypothetical protein